MMLGQVCEDHCYFSSMLYVSLYVFSYSFRMLHGSSLHGTCVFLARLLLVLYCSSYLSHLCAELRDGIACSGPARRCVGGVSSGCDESLPPLLV